jgi:septum formation protein
VTRQCLILASASPRRAALLAQIGIAPDQIIAAHVDETPLRGELPRACARRLARLKAEQIPAQDAVVLAADTVVAVGRRILPQAADRPSAAQCLTLLSGRRHRVFTAMALRAPDGTIRERISETAVIFNRLSQEQHAAYLASGEWQGKAGGYAIQGLAASFVRSLSGSYSGVVGLDLFQAAQLLRGAGWAVP